MVAVDRIQNTVNNNGTYLVLKMQIYTIRSTKDVSYNEEQKVPVQNTVIEESTYTESIYTR